MIERAAGEGEPRVDSVRTHPPARHSHRPAGTGWVPKLSRRRSSTSSGATSGSGSRSKDPLFPYCLEHFGEDCWVYGSDIPHGDRLKNVGKVLQKRADLSEQAKQKLLRRDNVAHYYDMPIPT